MSRKLKVALYAAFTLSMLGLSFLLTFPWDAVGRRLEYETVRAIPGASIAIEQVGPALPVGLALGDITLQLPGAGPGKQGPKLSVEKVRVKPSLFALATGKLAANFDVRAFSGTLEGQVKKSGPGQSLDLELVASTLQLDDGGVLEKLVGYPIQGGLSGRVDLAVDEKGVISDGNVDLVVAGARFGGGKISGFTVPALDLGAPELSVTFEKGQGKIGKLATKSDDLDFNLEDGSLSMRSQLPMSLIKGTARLKPSDAWLEKAKLKGIISMAPASIRKPDGTFELALNGTLTQPARLPSLGF